MKKLYFLSIIFVITSCGGGGGGGSSATPIVSIPFSLTLGFVSFSVNEDETYSGSIAATANESVTLQYTITSQPSQGSLTLSTNGDIHTSRHQIIMEVINFYTLLLLLKKV